MAKPILQKARNIYEQQKHNRRMTTLLIVVFVLLIAIIGVGFDVFLQIGLLARLIFLPFIVLMVVSSMFKFHRRAESGLWKEPETVVEDVDEDAMLTKLLLQIAFISLIVSVIMLYLFNHPRVLTQLLAGDFDYPVLRYIPIGTTLTVIIGIAAILTSLQWGKNSVLWSVQAEPPESNAETTQMLKNVVKEISIAAGIPAPSIYVVNDPDPNAFALGTTLKDSSIVITTGLLTMLNREELQSIIAHEISHIRNADTRLMTTITVLFGAVLLISEWMKKSTLHGGFVGSRIPGAGWSFRGILFVGWLITILLAPLIARIVAMAVSRQREFLADAGGAELTRNPKALARALIKIENAAEPTTSFQKGIAHLCVVDPLGRKVNSKEGWWADLFATHPPLKNRILLLNAMAYERVTSK